MQTDNIFYKQKYYKYKTKYLNLVKVYEMRGGMFSFLTPASTSASSDATAAWTTSMLATRACFCYPRVTRPDDLLQPTCHLV